MVEVEDRVTRRGRGITTRIDGVDVVAGGMDLQKLSALPSNISQRNLDRAVLTYTPGIGIVFRRRHPQQRVVEFVDIVALGQQLVSTIGRGSQRGTLVDVTS